MFFFVFFLMDCTAGITLCLSVTDCKPVTRHKVPQILFFVVRLIVWNLLSRLSTDYYSWKRGTVTSFSWICGPTLLTDRKTPNGVQHLPIFSLSICRLYAKWCHISCICRPMSSRPGRFQTDIKMATRQ